MNTNLEEIYCKLKEIVNNARTGDYSNAASLLNITLQELHPTLTSGKIPVEYLKKFTYSMETILLMQTQNDWVAVADVIEFEFTALLKEAIKAIEDM